MNKFILASVGNAQVLDPATGDIIVSSKTLVDSGINFSVTAEDIRGGMANALIGQYFHDSSMGITMTDSLFSLEYLALNVGGTVSYGAEAQTMEQVTTTEANKITVSSNAQNFLSLGAIGWYKMPTESDDAWKKITFVGKDATVSNLPQGTTVCVKYFKEDASAEKFTVSSAFIPTQATVILTLPLFKAGTEATTSYTSSSKVGEVQVTIPNFIFSGAQELSLTASGTSTSALSGNALSSFDGAEGCDAEGYYAKFVQVTYNKDEFADVKAIVVSHSDIELKVSETQTLEVLAIYGGNIAPRVIDNSKLTFTSSASSNAEVGANTGIVKAKANGNANIEVVVTSKPSLTAHAYVTVK